MTTLSAGDHLLMSDAVYRPSRSFANTTLKRMGIETEYYDPRVGAGIEALMRPNTTTIFAESPGSETFEIQDIPAIAAAAHARGACLIMDNTWATPLFFSPHEHGVDLAIEAGTKYLSGHSDLLLGLVSANEDMVRAAAPQPPICWAFRPGPRTCSSRCAACARMDLRLREAERQGLALARMAQRRGPKSCASSTPPCPIIRAMGFGSATSPALRASFRVVLKPVSEAAVAALLDGLELFGLGYSWAGYESLAVPFDCTARRTATRFAPGGPTVRFSVGLEDIEDLKADLDRGFARLRATA